MATQTEQILQKISFLEKDMELHRNILAAIPTGKEDEVEDVLRRIVEIKGKIEGLKHSLAEVDPEMHEQIKKLEKATSAFKKIASERQFQEVVSLDHSHECFLDLVDGRRLECLVKARDLAGNWVVISLEGDTMEFNAGEVGSPAA